MSFKDKMSRPRKLLMSLSPFVSLIDGPSRAPQGARHVPATSHPAGQGLTKVGSFGLTLQAIVHWRAVSIPQSLRASARARGGRLAGPRRRESRWSQPPRRPQKDGSPAWPDRERALPRRPRCRRYRRPARRRCRPATHRQPAQIGPSEAPCPAGGGELEGFAG